MPEGDSTLFRSLGRDSSVDIATCYGLHGPWIKSRRRGRAYPHSFRPALGPTQPPIQWVLFLFPGVKRPGCCVGHAPTSRAEVKERVEIYLYSRSGLSCPSLEWALPIHFTFLRTNGKYWLFDNVLRYGRLESCLSTFDSQEVFCLVTHTLKYASESHISQHFRLKRIAYPGYLILIIFKVLRDKANQFWLTNIRGCFRK